MIINYPLELISLIGVFIIHVCEKHFKRKTYPVTTLGSNCAIGLAIILMFVTDFTSGPYVILAYAITQGIDVYFYEQELKKYGCGASKPICDEYKGYKRVSFADMYGCWNNAVPYWNAKYLKRVIKKMTTGKRTCLQLVTPLGGASGLLRPEMACYKIIDETMFNQMMAAYLPVPQYRMLAIN